MVENPNTKLIRQILPIEKNESASKKIVYERICQ